MYIIGFIYFFILILYIAPKQIHVKVFKKSINAITTENYLTLAIVKC